MFCYLLAYLCVPGLSILMGARSVGDKVEFEN